jgi:hypothetical protein
MQQECVAILKMWDEREKEDHYRVIHYLPTEHRVIRSYEQICHRSEVEEMKRSPRDIFFVIIKNISKKFVY